MCRRFECGWVKDEGGGWSEDERPDRIEALVTPADPESEFTRATGLPLLVAYELRADALDSLHAQRLLERLGRKLLVGLMRFGWEESYGEPSAYVGPPELLRASRSPLAASGE